MGDSGNASGKSGLLASSKPQFQHKKKEAMKARTPGIFRTHGHLAVLLLGLPLVLIVWWFWMSTGMHVARDKIQQRVNSTGVAAQIPQPASAAADKVTAPPPSASERREAGERAYTELGQTGDSFGGLNALLTGVAGVVVAWAGTMQYIALQDERKHRKLQEFESLFFRLLDLTEKATSQIRGPAPQTFLTRPPPSPRPRRRGAAALNAHAQVVSNNSFRPEAGTNYDADALLNLLVVNFAKKVYDTAPSRFGPYYRLLYQVFKHIAEADHLAETEKVRYANIARGQLAEGAVFLLALNGLTVQGHSFVPLIERFGLLEHMHRQYQTDYGPLLQQAYRGRAFLGSEDRRDAKHAWIPTPLLPADHFQCIETDRYPHDGDDDSDD